MIEGSAVRVSCSQWMRESPDATSQPFRSPSSA
jgi:hypothetical protein